MRGGGVPGDRAHHPGKTKLRGVTAVERQYIDLILGTLHKEKQIWRIETMGVNPQAAREKAALVEAAERAFREAVGVD